MLKARPRGAQVEINHVVLGEMLQTLASDWRALGADLMMRQLASVALAGRFSLTSRLLVGAPKAAAARLFDDLAASAAEGADGTAAAEVARVRKLYAV